MRRLKLAALALVAMFGAPSAGAGVYLNAADWYTQAVVPNVVSGTAALAVMPAQNIVVRDYFGSYTAETRSDPVYIGVHGYAQDPDTFSSRAFAFQSDLSNAPGQMTGHFTCHSAVSRCLGAHTIRFTLPFDIVGLGGNLEYMFGYGGSADALPFFGFAHEFWEPSTFIQRPGDEHPLGYSYGGFWAKTFAATNVLTFVWPDGISNQDDFAFFKLDNLMVLKADMSGASPVPVPEPVSVALFGLGLAGLIVVRRRKVATLRAS
jgi:hypothetical protein